MLHELAGEMQAALIAKGCPFPVVDGPEPTKTASWSRERIVIEHDVDAFGPPRSQHKNPKHRMTRQVGVKLTIYAKSPAVGALEFEHRRRAEHVLDLVLVALGDVCSMRKIGCALKNGSFVIPEDLTDSAAPCGAAYELSFAVDRGVPVLTWQGEKRPEATLAVNAFAGDATFTAMDSAVTRTAGSWLDDGFVVGMAVRIVGSASNDGTGREITDLTATVMTLAATVADEGPVFCKIISGGFAGTRRVAIAGGNFESF